MKKTRYKLGEVDFILFATILILLAVGLVMVFSASSWTSTMNYDNAMFYFWKQLRWTGIGLLLMGLTMRFDYHRIKKLTLPLMVLTLILLFIVFGFGAINGATRWIDLGFASLQPSEIAKYVVVFYLANSIDIKGEKIKSFKSGVVPCLIVAITYAGLILAEKNLSICAVVMIVTIIILYVSNANIWHLLGLAAFVLFFGCAFIYFEPYRMDRLLYFINPWKDPTGKGFQLVQSLLALGSGGIWGSGIGHSRQKAFYMPESHTDFIFSVVGEELGLIGCTAIIILFIVFVWRGISASLKAKDTYGMVMATGITSIIALQSMINIAVVSGSFPVTGVPLPFISYGGSSLIFNLMAIGILLNITRQSAKTNTQHENKRNINNRQAI